MALRPTRPWPPGTSGLAHAGGEPAAAGVVRPPPAARRTRGSRSSSAPRCSTWRSPATRAGSTGVIVTEGAGHDPHLLPGRLVVDASGRTSRTPEWLERRGYPAPEEEVRRIDKHSTTRTFRRIPGPGPLADRGPGPTGPSARRGDGGGGGRPVDGDAQRAARPPAAHATWTGSWPTPGPSARPAIADTLAGATPLDEGMTYRFPANRRRHYERLTEFPDGAARDRGRAVRVRPGAGQGMTVAALEARELGRAASPSTATDRRTWPGCSTPGRRSTSTPRGPWSPTRRPVRWRRTGAGCSPRPRRTRCWPRRSCGSGSWWTGRRTCCGPGSCCASPARAAGAARVSAGSRPGPAATLPARRAAPHG